MIKITPKYNKFEDIIFKGKKDSSIEKRAEEIQAKGPIGSESQQEVFQAAGTFFRNLPVGTHEHKDMRFWGTNYLLSKGYDRDQIKEAIDYILELGS